MKRRILSRAVLASASAVLALALAEIAVRVLDVGPTFQNLERDVFRLSENPILGYELAPGAQDGTERINSAGFRDREFTPDKPAGVFRIVALGDSVTFGQKDRPLESWPKQLERVLGERAQGVRYEVLNLGVTGYNVLEIAERLRVLGLSYQPDLVVYGYVLNDPQEISIERECLLDLRQAAEDRFEQDLRRGVLRVLSASRVFLLARRALRGAPALEGVAYRHPVDPAYRALRAGDRRGAYFRGLHEDAGGRARLGAGLDRLAAAAADAGVPLVLAIFPLLGDPRSGPYPLSDVHRLVAEEARARGFDVIDLQPVLLDACAREPCALDFLHPNAAGHRAVADALAARLTALGRLRAAAPAPGPR